MKAKVIIGVTGSIAAYKAVDLARALQDCNYDIFIVLSKGAADFVSILTLKSLFAGKVYSWDEALDSSDQMIHIQLAKAADIVLITPASANTIAKLANGMADCLLSSICLATKSQIIIAPAMNKVMWENQFVQANIAVLKRAGVQIVGPADGVQACGDIGLGRMAEPSQIVEFCKAMTMPKIFQGKKIVITAGPTQERIDPVRFLTNYSSGKMGYALAGCASYMGANVTLITGPTSITKPSCNKVIAVESAAEMLQAALTEGEGADIFIATAAVADYRPKVYSESKIKKKEGAITLELVKNADIISHIKQSYPQIFCVGFAAETNNIQQNGLAKLIDKNLDMIAINDISNKQVFGKDDNELYIIARNQAHYHLKQDTKRIIAKQLLDIVYNFYFRDQ